MPGARHPRLLTPRGQAPYVSPWCFPNYFVKIAKCRWLVVER